MKLRPACIFLRRQIDDDQAIDAGGFCVDQKPVDAVDIDRVVVPHQDQRCRGVVAAKRAHHGEGLLQGHARLQRAQAGRLDRRPIGHRIGEGHADLDDVGAGFWQRLDNCKRGRKVGIASHQECHKG
jgi:hypothetical protein